jgi:hypothetical protein
MLLLAAQKKVLGRDKPERRTGLPAQAQIALE